MIKITIEVNASKLRRQMARYGFSNLSDEEIARIFTVTCNEIIDEHISWTMAEMRALRSNPATYGRGGTDDDTNP